MKKSTRAFIHGTIFSYIVGIVIIAIMTSLNYDFILMATLPVMQAIAFGFICKIAIGIWDRKKCLTNKSKL